MATIAEVIRQHHAEIVALWRQQAEKAASARGFSAPAFRNVMPVYLVALAERPDSPSAGDGARASVHNEGNPIPSENQAHMLRSVRTAD